MDGGIRVDLVSFAASSHCGALLDVLSKLGYLGTLVDGQHWLTRADRKNDAVTVLFVDDTGYPAATVESALTRICLAPELCIVHTDLALASCVVVKRCLDFLAWPCPAEELALRLRRARKRLEPAPPNCGLAKVLAQLRSYNIVGRSDTFLEIARLIARYATFDPPILIEGETGTGKEVVARALHYLGKRCEQPFVPVNCGAIPDELIENELFGHEAGAYTDARAPHPGLVAQAEGGTLFLDEVESLSAKGQVVLLRFLQDHEYKPLGGRHLRESDVRIIAATKENLRQLAAAGSFRQDLLYRLNVVRLVVPALCHHRADIAVLAELFVRQYCTKYKVAQKTLHAVTLDWMLRYDWPGNVRELENFIHRSVLTTQETVILPPVSADGGDHLLEPSGAGQASSLACFREAKAHAITLFERDYLSRLMALTNGNVTQAARQAGKERRSLGKLLKKHGITRKRYFP